MKEFKPAKDLIERNYWLIRLRWVAVVGVNVTIFPLTYGRGVWYPPV